MGERQLHLFGFDGGTRDIKRRNTVILPLDTFVLLLVVVVLLFVLAFSLGVERGRKVASRKIEDDKFNLEAVNLAQDNAALDLEYSRWEDKKQAVKESKKIALVDKKAPQDKGASSVNKQYIIQIATYLKEKIALEEAEKLKEKEYQVSVSKKGDYTVLFVGEFQKREEAQKTMQSLRKRYKDCFIRRLK
ncbi:MAG: SPOR domain-containing protein [Candidatus Omnitrophota bacterium]|nr:MAG: SPOR domain-containing protein [Candidatus Omnitrophota bacterium]